MHRAAAVGFDRAAGAYERGRAGYPAAGDRGDPRDYGRGAGTNVARARRRHRKAHARLVGSGARVIALEPVAGMRQHAREDRTGSGAARCRRGGDPARGCERRRGVAAQAFHWFDPEVAAAQVARVLAPGGAVALIWNRRDERVAWVRELSRILDGLAGDAPRYRTGLWRRGFDGNPAFEPLALRPGRTAEAGPRGVLDRVASVSFVAPSPRRPASALLAEVGNLLDTHPDTRGRDDVALPYVTELFTTRKL